MDFELPEPIQLLQQKARDYATQQVAPLAAELDAKEEFPVDLIAQAAKLGLLGILVPKEFGGTDMGNLAGSIVVEEVARACASTSVTISVHNSLVCTPLKRHATDAAKAKYLPKLATGETLGAYALSEAGSGSDAAALSCKAVKDGDHWVLEGSKLWITSGTHAGLFIVFARTSDPKPGEKMSRGVSAFLVDATAKGLSIGKKEEKLGIRASSTVEILLDQVSVPEENLLGVLDRGFRVAMETLDGGRIGIASQSLGIAQACLDASVDYAKKRHQFGRPIGEFQAIQWKLAQMASRLEGARLVTRRAALLRDQGKPCTQEAAMAKLLASQLANDAANEAVQIHGANGYSQEYPVERYFRDARICEIYEGTTEVQHLVIARGLMAAS